MKILVLLAGLLVQGIALAQTTRQADLDYSYLELRFVDVDTNGGDGDGIRFNGSYDFENNWLLVGGLTSLDSNNNVDATAFEIGAGYVWHHSADFDLVGTLRFVNLEIDDSFQSVDDSGLAFSAGARGLLTPEFEIRGSVNHTTVFDGDTYLELAGDYHFAEQFAAGLSLEFAGDNDIVSIGARWFF